MADRPLTADEAETLSDWLAEFADLWAEGRLAQGVADLPPAGHPLRRPALLGMAETDLRRRWAAGGRPNVESYLEAYPELAGPDGPPLALIQAEFDARVAAGERVTPSQFRLRFPRQAASLSGAGSVSPQSTAADSRPRPLGPPPALPEKFGRYKIVKCLGRGGMGAVYLAHDETLDRPVALKIPHFGDEAKAEALARFSREGRAASRLRHPNICPVYDVGEVNGTHYLTMAYIDGRSLAETLREDGPMPQRQAAELVRKLALALEEAHQHGVVHRDLKPANVMMTPRGEPVVMDFGLARRESHQSERMTQSGAVLGTPAYMAPEQVRGDLRAVGPQSDVYSLGMILYESLTGRLPFEGGVATILAKILTEDPESPSRHLPGLDEALEHVWAEATAKRPGDRYADMGKFAAALQRYLDGPSAAPSRSKAKASSAPATGESWRSRPTRSRGRLVVLGLTLVVGAAALALTRPWEKSPPPEPKKEPSAVAVVPPAEKQPVVEPPEPAKPDEPNGNDVVRAGDIPKSPGPKFALADRLRATCPNTNGTFRIVRAKVVAIAEGGEESEPLWSQAIAGAVELAVSPDGERLYVAGGGGLTALEAATGNLLFGAGKDYPASAVAVSPDGKRVAVGSVTALTCYDPDGSTIWQQKGATTAAAFSLDGELLFSLRRDKETRVHCVEAVTGKELWTAAIDGNPVMLRPVGRRGLAATDAANTTRLHEADSKGFTPGK